MYINKLEHTVCRNRVNRVFAICELLDIGHCQWHIAVLDIDNGTNNRILSMNIATINIFECKTRLFDFRNHVLPVQGVFVSIQVMQTKAKRHEQ